MNVTKFAERFQDLITQNYHDRERDLRERPIDQFVHQALREARQDHLSDEKVRSALNEMYAITEDCWRLEEDTHPTLKELTRRGFHLGIITNAADARDVARIIDTHELRGYFETIVISADLGIRKPDPRIFEVAMQRTASKPDNAVMVGDNLNADILGAHRAGLKGIWITRRSENPNTSLQRSSITPDAEITALAEIPALLERWNQ
ncbi:HAD family hydrolase [bacterium]|nr:HAD family hydrolase [bacterium]